MQHQNERVFTQNVLFSIRLYHLDATCSRTFQRIRQSDVSYDSRPRHVAVADLNQDDLEDLVIANTDIDNIGIRLGYGNGSFGEQIIYSTGSGSRPYWVAVKDLNNDHLLDIIVANYGTNSIGIFLGDGKGQLTSYLTLSLGASRPLSLDLGHFNDDNEWDIALVTNSTFSMMILYGRGDGSFQIERSIFMGYDSIPCSIAVADLNHDHRSDIVVVNYGTSELVLFLSNGNETFVVNKYSTGSNGHPTSLTIDYLDKDNYLDIAVANSATHNIGVFLGDANADFRSIKTYPTGSDSYLHFIVADRFNADSNCDLAVIDSNANYLMIYAGDKDGIFSIVTNQSLGYGLTSLAIAVADFNHDNQWDIAVVNNENNAILILTLYTFHTVVKQNSYLTSRRSFARYLSVADVNNDGYLDILVANTYVQNIGVFIGLGDGTFKSQEIVPVSFNAHLHATGDFNKDKKLDMVVVFSDNDQINIYFGYGNGSFYLKHFYPLKPESAPISVVIADFNNDDNLDIITANSLSNNLGIFLGKIDGTFFEAIYYNFTDHHHSPLFIVATDFNDDGFTDLVSIFVDSSTVTILLSTTEGIFQRSKSFILDNYHPTWIVIGDLNNDGRQDIVLTSKGSSMFCILTGNGDGTFVDRFLNVNNGDASLQGVALGDFNKDKILDIAVLNNNDLSITLFWTNFNQSLSEQTKIVNEDGYPSLRIVTGDFDNDGETDMVVINNGNDNITVFLVTYRAVFTNQRSIDQTSAKHPYSITMADFDHDHQMDIAIANSGQNSIEIMMKYHNEIFMNKIILLTGDHSYPRGVIAGDFDRDYQLDIAIVNHHEHTLLILLNPMNETSTQSFTYSTGIGSFPDSISTGDINNDGWIDIIVTCSKSDSMNLFLGFDYPAFIVDHGIEFLSDVAPQDIVVGDFNGDSLWDLAVVYQETRVLEVLLGNRDGTFSNQSSNFVWDYEYIITFLAGDFNNDNQLDLAVACWPSETIFILLGTGNGTFLTDISQSTGKYWPQFIVSADLNHDGALDLVTANQFNGSIGVFLGYGNGSLTEQVVYHMPNQSRIVWIAIGDLNNDDISDITTANMDTNSIGIYFGTGDGTLNNLTIYSTGINSAPCSVAIGDFDKDNCTDIAVLNSGTRTVGIFFGFGNGTFSTQVVYPMKWNSILRSMVVEDLNNDGILDVAVANSVDKNENIDVFYGLGERRFLTTNTYATNYRTEVLFMVAKDLNNDSRIDFLISLWKVNQIVIMSADRTEPFGSSTTFPLGTSGSPCTVAISDLNSDDRLDIAVANAEANKILILFGDGNGNFTKGEMYSVGVAASPSSIVIGDVNGDKQNDILVTNSHSNEIGIFYSYGNGTFEDVQTYQIGPGTEPSSISIADLDKDNLIDIVVANTGISTIVIFYGTGNRTFLKRESYSLGYNYRPISVVIGDVNNDGWLDIGVANYESGSADVLAHHCERERSVS